MQDYADVTAPKKDNPSGTRLKVSFAPIDDFETIPKEGESAAALGDLAVVSTDLTFKTDKNFFTFELEVNKNELNAEYQGAVRGNADKHTFTGMIPNIDANIAGLLRQARNHQHIVLIHLSDDQVLMLGEEDNGASIKSNFQTGTQEGGERGFMVTIESYHYMKLYTGAVSYTPAV